MSKKNERPATVILDRDMRDDVVIAFIIYADRTAECRSVRLRHGQVLEMAVLSLLSGLHHDSTIYLDFRDVSLRRVVPPRAILREMEIRGAVHIAETTTPTSTCVAQDPGFNEQKYGPANLEHSMRKFEDRLSRIEKAFAAPRIIINSPTQLHEHLISHLEDGSCWIRTVDPVTNESYMRSESTENVYREVDRARGGVADVIIPIDMTRDELVRKTAYLVAQLEALDGGR